MHDFPWFCFQLSGSVPDLWGLFSQTGEFQVEPCISGLLSELPSLGEILFLQMLHSSNFIAWILKILWDKNILSSQDWGGISAAYSLGMYMAALWINTCQTLLLWNSCGGSDDRHLFYFITVFYLISFQFSKGESTDSYFPFMFDINKAPWEGEWMLTGNYIN